MKNTLTIESCYNKFRESAIENWEKWKLRDNLDCLKQELMNIALFLLLKNVFKNIIWIYVKGYTYLIKDVTYNIIFWINDYYKYSSSNIQESFNKVNAV